MSDEKPLEVTPTEGAMTQEEHTAFIMRIFLYLVETQPNHVLSVDLKEVLDKTKGKLLQVRLEDGQFHARTTQGVMLPKFGEGIKQ